MTLEFLNPSRSFDEVRNAIRFIGHDGMFEVPFFVEVEALDLKEGDEIDIRVAGERAFDIERDRTRERALERIRSMRRPLPIGWKFDRDEANSR